METYCCYVDLVVHFNLAIMILLFISFNVFIQMQYSWPSGPSVVFKYIKINMNKMNRVVAYENEERSNCSLSHAFTMKT